MQALDWAAPRRLPAVLHADDPVLLASSRGGAQKSLQVLAAWAYKHKASPHTKATKHAVMVSGGRRSLQASQKEEPLVLVLVGQEPMPIAMVTKHRWLGLPWRSDLDLQAMGRERVSAAASHVSTLAGLVTREELPLSAAAGVFDLQVEASFRFGRWLWGPVSGDEKAADAAYESWARLFLGVPPWRGPAAALSEMGWRLSGSARLVGDVASRRAALWALPDGDLYRDVFLGAHAWEGDTWAKASQFLLSSWGVPDWPVWAIRHPGGTRDGYKTEVQDTLARISEERWLQAAGQHLLPIPYLSLRPGISTDLQKIGGSLSPSWEVLLGQRSLSRLRMGALALGHESGRRSWARSQACILCGIRTRSRTFHVLGVCEAAEGKRADFWHARGTPQPESKESCAVAILSSTPDQPGYAEAAMLALAVDKAEARFWSGTAAA